MAALPDVAFDRDGYRLDSALRGRASHVPRVLAAAKELDATITKLEIHEPNLERVFLHLTGRDLDRLR